MDNEIKQAPIDTILLLQVEENKFYDKDGTLYTKPAGRSGIFCSVCKAEVTEYFTGLNSILCTNCTTILTIKELLEAQLFKIELEELRQVRIEVEKQQRSVRELAKIEDTACFIYEGFAHFDEIAHLFRRPYWTDLCNSDKERWYHTAEHYRSLTGAIEEAS